MKRSALLTALVMLCSCGPQGDSALPDQPDRWLTSISLQDDSVVHHVGKTSVIGSTTVKPISGLHGIGLGDDIDGVRVGAIKCTFFNKDASNSGDQFMWRGRWGCQAGRDQDEVNNALQDDGTKLYDYIYVSPVTIDAREG